MGFPEGAPRPQLELPDITGAMQAECRQAGSAMEYVERLRERYAHTNTVQILGQLASLIEPVGGGEANGSFQPTAEAYVYGGLLGMRVAEEAYGDEADKLMEFMEVSVPDSDDSTDMPAFRYRVAGVLLECSDQGIRYAPQYEDMVDEWSDTLCADASRRHFVKRGFGIMVFGMKQYFERRQAELDYSRDREAFEKSLESIDEYDWDAHFDELER